MFAAIGPSCTAELCSPNRYLRGRVSEEQTWLDRFLDRPEVEAVAPTVLAVALAWSAVRGLNVGGPGRRRERAERAIAAGRASADPRLLAETLTAVGIVHGWRGEAPDVRRYLDEARRIWLGLGEDAWAEAALGGTGFAALSEGDLGAARTLFGRQAAAMRRLGETGAVAGALEWLANVELTADDPVAAQRLFAEALELHRGIEDRWGVAHAFLGLGLCAVAAGDGGVARVRFGECLSELRDTHDVVWLPWALEGLAGMAALDGRPRRAIELAGAAEACREASGRALWPVFGRQVERWLAPARAAVDRAAADAAWREGLRMSFDQAVEYALDDEADA
jgi:hypothetical protein